MSAKTPYFPQRNKGVMPASYQRGINDVLAHFARINSTQRTSLVRPYEQVVAVFRCVNFIGEALASMPFVVVTAQDKIIDSGPIAELIDKPNSNQSIDDFFWHFAGWLFLSTRVHQVMLKPNEVVIAPAEQLRPRFAGYGVSSGESGSGDMVGWWYRPAGKRWEQAQPLELDQVWTTRLPKFDTSNTLDGASTLDVVRMAVRQVFKADVANESNLDHDVQPGGVFSAPPGVALTEDQRRENIAAIRERNAGYANRGRDLFLEGGMTFEKLSATFAEMEFRELKLISRADICAGFGLNDAGIFPPEGGRATEYVDTAKNSNWIDRVIPLGAFLAGQFERFVLSKYEGDRSLILDKSIRGATRSLDRRQRMSLGYKRAIGRRAHRGDRQLYAFFDDSGVAAVRKAMLDLSKQGAILIEKFLQPPGDVIEAFDLPLEVHPHQRDAWQPVGLMRVDEPAPGDDDPPAPAPAPAPAPEDQPAPDPEDDPADDPGQNPSKGSKHHTTVDKDLDDKLGRLWQVWRATWERTEKQWASKHRAVLMDLRSETLANLKRATADRSLGGDGDATVGVPLHWMDDKGFIRQRTYRLTVTQRDLLGEILFDLTRANNKLLASLRPLAREATRLGGQAVMNEADPPDASEDETPDVFNLNDPGVKAALKRRDQAITGMNTRVRQRLSRVLAEGLETGKSPTDLADAVRHQFNVESRRAKTVAFQEVGSAVEEARHEGRKQAKVPLKSWLWSRKAEGRPRHGATENNTTQSPIPIDQDFVIAGTGITCPHPRATGVAEEDINCGCTTLSRYPGDTIKAALGRTTRALRALEIKP